MDAAVDDVQRCCRLTIMIKKQTILRNYVNQSGKSNFKRAFEF